MYARAFTLPEILIVTAISLFFVVGAMAVYQNFNKTRALDVGAQNILSLLKTARSKTLASDEASVYGVHFEATRVVLFKGSVFTEPQDGNKEYSLPRTITISNINLNGGGSDVIFERLTGETGQFGTTTISASDLSKTIYVFVDKTGIIDY
jgi:Tfp pilus assembly protein FimT